jgi:hypothetical protein
MRAQLDGLRRLHAKQSCGSRGERASGSRADGPLDPEEKSQYFEVIPGFLARGRRSIREVPQTSA